MVVQTSHVLLTQDKIAPITRHDWSNAGLPQIRCVTNSYFLSRCMTVAWSWFLLWLGRSLLRMPRCDNSAVTSKRSLTEWSSGTWNTTYIWTIRSDLTDEHQKDNPKYAMKGFSFRANSGGGIHPLAMNPATIFNQHIPRRRPAHFGTPPKTLVPN